ncbi:MAG: dehydrogenase, partial [Bacteroidetes bacterium]|nr:dehydrogenase [Bacteroidota bacterium]
AVLASLSKTNRLVVLHEATRMAGFGSEIAAEIAEAAWEHLDAPPIRVGAEATPVPFSKSLEAIYSAKGRLAGAIKRVLAY